MSIRPKASTVEAAHASVESSEEMSVCTNRTLSSSNPAERSTSIPADPRSWLISAITTFAPSFRNRSAYESPMPWPAPVMTATRSWSLAEPLPDSRGFTHERWITFIVAVTTASPSWSANTFSMTMNVIVRSPVGFS